MSAKNAWGKSTGYAEKLIDQGVEKSRAQQLENWANQQEILRSKNAHRAMAETFDQVQSSGEADWRTLAKFGVERNQVCLVLVCVCVDSCLYLNLYECK